MKTTIGKLRNITTSILHTNMDDVYQFFEDYIGAKGIMTHHLPSAGKAIMPILKSKLPSEHFTDEWLKEGLEKTIEIPDLSDEEKKAFWTEFEKYNRELWNSISDKTIVVKQ